MIARDLIKSGHVVAGLADLELPSLMFSMESLAHLRSRLRVMCFLTKTPRSHMQRLCLSPKHQPDLGVHLRCAMPGGFTHFGDQGQIWRCHARGSACGLGLCRKKVLADI